MPTIEIGSRATKPAAANFKVPGTVNRSRYGASTTRTLPPIADGIGGSRPAKLPWSVEFGGRSVSDFRIDQDGVPEEDRRGHHGRAIQTIGLR